MTNSERPENKLIVAFAKRHKIHWRIDEDDFDGADGYFPAFIPSGRKALGQTHIFDYGDGVHFGLMYLPRTFRPSRWEGVRKQCLAAGMTLHQNGDSEGSLLFDPDNDAQAKLAISIVKPRVKRILSPERRAALLASSKPFVKGVAHVAPLQ
jgi:hypothetical protein